MSITITDVVARDIRFPTSIGLHGSDAMNPDPDYSAAYVVLHTDQGQRITFVLLGQGRLAAL